MVNRFFERTEIQTGRQYELDLLKALSIISMIICHAVYMLGVAQPGYETDIRYWFADIVLGDFIGVAHAFMFAMGVGIVYSRKNTPGALIRRGIRLYLLALVLNFFRYGIYVLADGIIEGEFLMNPVYVITVLDILQFAGLALIATGIFKLLKLNELQIALAGIALSVFGSFAAFCFHDGAVFNWVLGHFIMTDEDYACFVFCNWYVFVGLGLLFGAILRRIKNVERFYRRLFVIAFPLMVVYVALSAVFGADFLSKHHYYYAVSLPSALGYLSIDLTLLCAFHALLKKIRVERLSVFVTMSRNINRMYCIHWCFVGAVDSICCHLLEIAFPYPVMYLFGVVLIFVSYWLSKMIEARRSSDV